MKTKVYKTRGKSLLEVWLVRACNVADSVSKKHI